jgi:DNA-binding NarL/FixJ family response regulator
MPLIFSIAESPAHPDYSSLYRRLGLDHERLDSMRKAMAALKKSRPDFVVAEFFYGFGNNYAGVNVSNLDVFLHSLRRYAPEAKVIVLVDKSEAQFVDKLAALFPLYEVIVQPVRETQLEKVLGNALNTEEGSE